LASRAGHRGAERLLVLLAARDFAERGDGRDFAHAAHEHGVAIRFEDSEIGIDHVSVASAVGRHDIAHGESRAGGELRLEDRRGAQCGRLLEVVLGEQSER
jgi:hypothetical protein